MAKELTAKIKLQCPGGQATPAPPVGPALGQHGVNIGEFVKRFNDSTRDQAGGVAFGVTLGVYRIITGTPLHLYIAFGYLFLIVQTVFAPKTIIPLAYDTGGVTTSTITVPVLAALGIGLASNIPGRSPIMDGFGLIAFACLFPIIAVLAYAMIGQWLENRYQKSK